MAQRSRRPQQRGQRDATEADVVGDSWESVFGDMNEEEFHAFIDSIDQTWAELEAEEPAPGAGCNTSLINR